MFPEVLHPVVLPLTIAIYNLLSIIGIFPKIEIDKKVIHHHLRFTTYFQYLSSFDIFILFFSLSCFRYAIEPDHHTHSTSSNSNNLTSSNILHNNQQPEIDVIAERRKAKALKVTSFISIYLSYLFLNCCFLFSYLMQKWLS